MKSLILRHWESYFLGQFMVATVLVVFGYTPMLVAVSILGIVNLWMLFALALTYAIDKLYKWWKEKAIIVSTVVDKDTVTPEEPKHEYKDTDLKDAIDKARKTVISPEDPTEVTE